jgi:LmbE family N-acetylglucosaminyl deacetylase
MRILILSAHTDDAELGAGGSIIRYLEEGHEISWLVFSSANHSLPNDMPPDTLKKEFQSVTDELGVKDYQVFDFRVRHLHKKRQSALSPFAPLRILLRS